MSLKIQGRTLLSIRDYAKGFQDNRPDIVPIKRTPSDTTRSLRIRLILLIVTAIMSMGHSVPIVMANYKPDFLPEFLQVPFLYLMGLCGFLAFEVALVVYQSQERRDIPTRLAMLVFFMVLLIANIGGGLEAAQNDLQRLVAVVYGAAIPISALALGSSFHQVQVSAKQEIEEIERDYLAQQTTYRSALVKSYRAYLKRQKITDDTIVSALISGDYEEFLDSEEPETTTPPVAETTTPLKEPKAKSPQASVLLDVVNFIVANPDYLTGAENTKKLQSVFSITPATVSRARKQAREQLGKKQEISDTQETTAEISQEISEVS